MGSARTPGSTRAGGDAHVAAGVILALAALYLAVFRLTGSEASWLRDTLLALANAAPAVLLGWAVAAAAVPSGMTLAMPWRVAVWIAIVALYAIATYLVTVLLLALLGDVGAEGVFVRFFTGPALTWQLFQGVAYGVVALLTGLLQQARRETALTLARGAAAMAAASASAAPPDRWLIRTDEGIVPVEPESIIHIRAADDYCELILPVGRHLARMTIGDCENRLSAHGFMRVHRSHLVNLARLVSAESAGNGRLQLLLSNGDRVVTSRAGAQGVRARAV